MEIFENYCGKRTYQFFTLFVAIPGTNVLYRRIFVIFSVLILGTSVIFQVLKFFTDGFTLKLLVVLLPTIAAILGCLLYLLHLTFAAHMPFQYGCMLSIMKSALNQEKNQEEKAIKQRYMANTKMFINMYTLVLIFMLIGMTLSGFIPSFLDIIMPLNYTRKNELIYEGEIFVDQDKYFYHIYFFECLSAVATVILVVVSVNMCVIVMQYSCSMSAILGYRLENLTNIREEQLVEKIDFEQILTRRLRRCIHNHQTIIELGVLIAEFYDIPLSVILIGTFCTLTMSLVQVTDTELISVKIIVYTVAQVIQLFLVNCMGQALMDASMQTSVDAYNSEWDTCPGNVRKLLQLMILRSSKPTMVVARGLYIFSVESYMGVIQMVTSFYMVLRRTQ